MRYFFRVEYRGTCYSGWQKQKSESSIQASLEEALGTVLRKPCKVTGAGRTDAGVHAEAQGAHIDTDIQISSCASVENSVNALLKSDISIYNFQPVPDSFHARYSAVERNYLYRIVCRKRPLFQNMSWQVHYKVDWNLIEESIERLKGRHDFSAFCAAGHSLKNMCCNIMETKLEECGGIYTVSITADRFLYKMVRNIVGTLVDIGRGKIIRGISEIVESRYRNAAGETAPACGLVLNNVVYKEVSDEKR